MPDHALDLPPVNIVEREKFTPTQAEWAILIDHLRTRRPWAYKLLLIQGCTGARIHEVARLPWRAVNFGDCEIRVPARTKTGSRGVSIPESLRDFFAETPEAERVGRILGEVSEGTIKCLIYEYLHEACDAVGIPYIGGTHALRRMVVDEYYRNGAEVGTVAAQLGMSPVTALKAYRRATTADRALAVARAGLGVPKPAVDCPVVDLNARRAG